MINKRNDMHTSLQHEVPCNSPHDPVHKLWVRTPVVLPHLNIQIQTADRQILDMYRNSYATCHVAVGRLGYAWEWILQPASPLISWWLSLQSVLWIRIIQMRIQILISASVDTDPEPDPDPCLEKMYPDPNPALGERFLLVLFPL